MAKLCLKSLKKNKRKYSFDKGTIGKIADNLSYQHQLYHQRLWH